MISLTNRFYLHQGLVPDNHLGLPLCAPHTEGKYREVLPLVYPNMDPEAFEDIAPEFKAKLLPRDAPDIRVIGVVLERAPNPVWLFIVCPLDGYYMLDKLKTSTFKHVVGIFVNPPADIRELINEGVRYNFMKFLEVAMHMSLGLGAGDSDV